MKIKLCPDCKDRPLKYFNKKYSKRCIPCTNAYDITRRNKYHKKSTNVLEERECIKCSKLFKPLTHKQTYCHDPCKTGKTRIEQFLERN